MMMRSALSFLIYGPKMLMSPDPKMRHRSKFKDSGAVLPCDLKRFEGRFRCRFSHKSSESRQNWFLCSAYWFFFFFFKNPQLLLSLPYCLESPVLQLFVFEEKMLEEWLDTEKLTSNKDARLFLIFKLLIRKRLKSLNWHLECNMSKQAPRENDSNLVICKNIAKNPRLAPKI